VTNSFSLLTISGGSGVPPGTRPETCKRCKGSGVVSIVLNITFFNNVLLLLLLLLLLLW